MQHFLIKSCLLAAICHSFAYADSVSMTESLKDQLKCTKSSKICTVETVGKFNVAARISGAAFEDYGIFLENISESTPIEINVGDYAFASTLAAADSHTLTSTKVAAKWPETHDECLDATCTQTKPVIDKKVTVNGGVNGIVLKISGKSKAGVYDTYGPRAFADFCDEAGDRVVLYKDATLTVDGVDLVGHLEVSCNIRTKKVTKYDQSFDLVSTTVRARLLNF